MNATTLLEGHGLTKRFGGVLALDNVDITIEKGTIMGLIGPNGAGKTTLFNALSGTYPLTAGKILFKGKDITNRHADKICKLGIARTFQIPRPFPEMTCFENVKVAIINRPEGVKGTTVEAVADDILEFLGLSHRRETEAKHLNLIEKKRLEMARALATDPELLLLDEVLAGLNTQEIGEAITLIRRLRDERQITILWIEHVMGAIMKVAEKILVLDQGRKLMEGTPEEVVHDPKVIQAYLGE